MYATLADMLARFDEADLVQLTDQAGAGVIDEARVNTALTSASTLIDGYVAMKYRTSSVPIPSLLVDVACDIARHRLFRDTPPDAVVAARKAAIDTLDKIQKGTIKLDAGEETLVARPGAIRVDRRDRLFGRDSMGGF